jgi:peptidyl-dipeptidase A
MLTTEGFAMMLDKLVLNPHWIAKMVGLPEAEKAAMVPDARKMLAFNSLAFARWCLVMLHFERAMYADPKQDLSALWWDLVERYQGLKRPAGRSAPDFASKVHLVVAPVYYHNYMMGEVFGAQLHATIARDVEKVADPFEAVYAGKPEVGAFLKRALFEPGARQDWRELTKAITGEGLSPKAYAAQFAWVLAR